MKKFLGVCLLLVAMMNPITLNAEKRAANQDEVYDAFQGILPVTDATVQKSLNGIWQLKVMKGITSDTSVPTADGSWRTIPVPGCWEAYGFCTPRYNYPDSLTGYYRTSFTVPENWQKQHVVLRMDGVLRAYDLWLNGQYVGKWESAYNTRLWDITPYLKKDGTQELAMRVYSRYKGYEFDCYDDWAPMGIFRDVTLFTVPESHLSDVAVQALPDGHVSVDVQVAHAVKAQFLRMEIQDASGQVAAQVQQPLTKGALTSISNNLVITNPHPWTAETPYLYTLRLQLMQKGKVLQTNERKIGLRRLTIDGATVLLNGSPVKFRGVTCHSTSPTMVKVVPDSLTLKDMRLMKEASVNYIRTSHYPREPRFYELCDSLGFYVVSEVPFGFGDNHLKDTTYMDILRTRARATVGRDKTHPSVMIWSLGNENPLTDMCVRLGKEVKQLEPTRPICYPQVGSYFLSLNFNIPKSVDIYAPHYPRTGQIKSRYGHPDRPVLFTEYCHSLGISFEDHDRQWELIQDNPSILGGSVWEWVDQGMPFSLKHSEPRISGTRYGYEQRVFTSTDGGFEMYGNFGTDGLLYANRIPLPNYYELQHNYARACVMDSAIQLSIPIGTSSSAAQSVSVPFTVRSRYDFINLKDHVYFQWKLTVDRDTIAQGEFTPDCAPRSEAQCSLSLPVLDATKLALLHFTVKDEAGRIFLRQTVRVNSCDVAQRLLTAIEKTAVTKRDIVNHNDDVNPMGLLQEGFLIRCGRKATMAERLKVKDERIEHYLVPLQGKLQLNQKSATMQETVHTDAYSLGTTVKMTQIGAATQIQFSITPDTTQHKFLSELGLGFLLSPQIDRVQWIGQGDMPTYPGRNRANRYGVWNKQAGDLYMEGNREGVDAAWLSDAAGNGLLFICQQGNINLEQTDRGIVVTYNAAVSGEGPKFGVTSFPVWSDKVGTVSGSFYLYRTEAGKLPQSLLQLFQCPSQLPAAYHPFLTQYDTYLQRYADIVGK